MKTKEEEAIEAINKWEETGEVPARELLGRLIIMNKEVGMVVFNSLVWKQKFGCFRYQ